MDIWSVCPFYFSEVINMADTIQIKGGKREGMPPLAEREMAYVSDEKALYIGTDKGNQKLCSADTEQKVANYGARFADIDLELGSKLTAKKVVSLAELGAGVDLATVIAAYNSLIAALKASGVMTGDSGGANG